MEWSLYLVRTRDGHLYTGIATDVARRFDEHTAGAKGAKYLRGRGPLELVHAWEIGGRSLALRAEAALKRRSKAEKESIAASPPRATELISELGLADFGPAPDNS